MQNGHQLQGALENVFTQAIRLCLAIERLKAIILKSYDWLIPPRRLILSKYFIHLLFIYILIGLHSPSK